MMWSTGVDLQGSVVEWECEWKLNQHVDVIFHPSDFVDEDPLLLADACYVSPKPGFHFLRDELASAFRAEHNMNWVVHIGYGTLPTAKPWATLLARLRRSVSCCFPLIRVSPPDSSSGNTPEPETGGSPA